MSHRVLRRLALTAAAALLPLRVPLDPGWSLMLYTDGLIEGRVPRRPGQRLWEEGLLELLGEERDVDLEELPARLVGRAQTLNGGPLLHDVAILLLSMDAAPTDAAPADLAPAGRGLSTTPS